MNPFDFGLRRERDFEEEEDQRDVDSYVFYRFTPGWYVETQGGWWDPEWAAQVQSQMQQRGAQHQGPRPQRPIANMMAGPEGHGDLRNNPAADQAQIQGVVVPDVSLQNASGLRNTLPVGQPIQHTPVSSQPSVQPVPAPAPSGSGPACPAAPHVPVVLPSNAPQAVRYPAAPQNIPPPTFARNQQLPLALRPPPPAGHTDQPPVRVHPDNYLTSYGRPKRNVQWPMNIEISLMEICTFCPNWLQNPEVIGRAICNDWKREDLAKAQLLAENPANRDGLEKRIGKIQKQISKGCKLLDCEPETSRFNAEDFKKRHGIQRDLTANAWRFNCAYDNNRITEFLGDMPLKAFYENVTTWPAGNDRLLMTQCLEFARQNEDRQLDSSHWDWIITSQNLAPPPALANGMHRDTEALDGLDQRPNPP